MTLRATLFASCALISALASAAPTTVTVSGLEVADAASLVADIKLSTYSAPNWSLLETMTVSAPLGPDGKRHVTFAPDDGKAPQAVKVEIKLRKSNYPTSSYSPIEFYVANQLDPSTYPSTRNTLVADCDGNFVVDFGDYLLLAAAFHPVPSSPSNSMAGFTRYRAESVSRTEPAALHLPMIAISCC
jgi:hypothetical protein